MPQSAFEPQKSSDRSLEGHRWRSLKAGPEERVVKITQQPQTALRVFIVDRDSMSSDLLSSALGRDHRCQAAAIQPSELLNALANSDVDLIVIAADLDSRSGSGFDLANAVCRAHPNIYIVMLMNQTTHELVINAFRSGARGVFSRQLPMTEFLDCVEHVGKGFIWAGKQETNTLLEAFKSIPAPNLLSASNSPSLTVRELQVVQCAAKGKTNKTIASELCLSEHTVKNYLFRAFEKLGVSSRVELLFYLTIRGHTFTATRPDPVEGDLSENEPELIKNRPKLGGPHSCE
jgi:two-component system nitrate/nitrite response regulator NarL